MQHLLCTQSPPLRWETPKTQYFSSEWCCHYSPESAEMEITNVASALINALIHSEKETAVTFSRSFKALMAWVASVVPGVVLFTMFYTENI